MQARQASASGRGLRWPVTRPVSASPEGAGCQLEPVTVCSGAGAGRAREPGVGGITIFLRRCVWGLCVCLQRLGGR